LSLLIIVRIIILIVRYSDSLAGSRMYEFTMIAALK